LAAAAPFSKMAKYCLPFAGDDEKTYDGKKS
jgi:hypothetical protein